VYKKNSQAVIEYCGISIDQLDKREIVSLIYIRSIINVFKIKEVFFVKINFRRTYPFGVRHPLARIPFKLGWRKR